jgi:hypothetical protein
MRRATLHRLAVALAAIAGAGCVASALAHDAGEVMARSGSWRATLVSAANPAPGVRVTLLPGRVPGLFLESFSADTVVILGRSGEPFLRFSPRGVEANVRSPIWRENALASGRSPPALADPQAPAEWQRVSRSPRLGWIEFRAWPGTDVPSAQALRRSGHPPRWAWSIPARVGNRPISFFGLTTWQPAGSRQAAR